MKKINTVLLLVPALLMTSSVYAEVSCHGPHKDGNTWSLVCSEDGKGDTDYMCNYSIAIKNADGQSDAVSASGTVGRNEKDVVIWSAIENGGSDIVSAKIDEGSCDPQ